MTLNTPRGLTRDNIRVMRKQEDAAYRISNEHLKEIANLGTYLSWRSKMVVWYYSMAIANDFQKETVEMTMSMVDRYVAANTDLAMDPNKYKIASMTCFYTASKINEQECLTPQQISSLGRKHCTPKDIEEVELAMLSAIQWRVNPPTAISFAQKLMELVPLEKIPDRRSILNTVEKQIELAMTDAELMASGASSIGFASLMTALQCVLGSSRLSYFYHLFSRNIGFESASDKSKLDKLQKRLSSLLVGSPMNRGLNKKYAGSSKDERIKEPFNRKSPSQSPVSPTSVVQQVTRRHGIAKWEKHTDATRIN